MPVQCTVVQTAHTGIARFVGRVFGPPVTLPMLEAVGLDESDRLVQRARVLAKHLEVRRRAVAVAVVAHVGARMVRWVLRIVVREVVHVRLQWQRLIRRPDLCRIAIQNTETSVPVQIEERVCMYV